MVLGLTIVLNVRISLKRHKNEILKYNRLLFFKDIKTAISIDIRTNENCTSNYGNIALNQKQVNINKKIYTIE